MTHEDPYPCLILMAGSGELGSRWLWVQRVLTQPAGLPSASTGPHDLHLMEVCHTWPSCHTL